LIENEDLCGLAGGSSFPLLTGRQGGVALDDWNSPQTVPTRCSFLKIGRNYVITASGGVDIDSWSVASMNRVDATIGAARGEASKPDDAGWWWN
jgi:hypothetical protein